MAGPFGSVRARTGSGGSLRCGVRGRVMHSACSQESRRHPVSIEQRAAAPTTALDVDDILLGDLETWLRRDREGIFAKLRDERPVSFHAEPELETMPRGPGFWAITRFSDVMHVSRSPELFVSSRGGTNIGDIPPELAEFLG